MGWNGMDEENETGQKAFIREGERCLYRISFRSCINFSM